jgi:hydrogenase nickel incorporation protein HypA/HybF
MHEVSILENAIEIIQEVAKEKNLKKITSIVFSVGELSGASTEALHFAFQSISPGTILENSELIINKIKAISKCNSCETEFEVSNQNRFCPNCNEFARNTISGQELFIEKIIGQ